MKQFEITHLRFLNTWICPCSTSLLRALVGNNTNFITIDIKVLIFWECACRYYHLLVRASRLTDLIDLLRKHSRKEHFPVQILAERRERIERRWLLDYFSIESSRFRLNASTMSHPLKEIKIARNMSQSQS